LSFYYNQVTRYKDFTAPLSGLVISSSHNVTQVVPIFDGRVHVSNSKRISIGGSHHNELLSKSLNLRYPVHKAKLTHQVVQEIQEKHTACALNYSDQLKFFEREYETESKKILEVETLKRKLLYEGSAALNAKLDEPKINESTLKVYRSSVDYANSKLEDDPVQQDRLVQLEWTKVDQPTEEDKKKKEAMRKEQGHRLREINLKKREEKQKKLSKELFQIEPFENEHLEEEKLKELGHKSMEEMLERLEYLREKLGITPKEEKKDEDKWPLINIDDAELDDDQRKMKRIQKMQKSSYIKRMEKRKKDEAEKQRIDKMKTEDPESYIKNLYAKRKTIYKRIELRKEKKEQMSKRDGFKRKMKTIAQIGAINDETKNKKKEDSEEDDFGINDDDWQLYKTIAKPGYEEDDEVEDLQALDDINEKIAEVDANYN
jgi:actin-related protein 5